MNKRALTSIQRERRKTAYHEAAHAVLMQLQGRAFNFIEVFDDGGGLAGTFSGEQVMATGCMNMPVSTLAGFSDAMALAVVLMAGVAATRKLNYCSWIEAILGEGHNDYSEAIHLMGYFLREKAVGRYVDSILPISNRMINERWGTITRIGDALVESRRLSYEDVERIAQLPRIMRRTA